MKQPLILRVKTIGRSRNGHRKPCTLIQAMRHNLRELQAEQGAREQISPELSWKNVVLHGPCKSQAVADLAELLKDKHCASKRKLRVDHVQALEFVFSLRNDTDLDQQAYFIACTKWLIQVFGSEMLLSAVVHHDEAAPHMHALVLPIVDGLYVGGAPISRPRLPRLIRGFAEDVGEPFGLSLEPRNRLTSSQRIKAVELILKVLTEHEDPVLSSCIWRVVYQVIEREPMTFVEHMNLKLPAASAKRKMRTSVQIFTSTGKRTSEDRIRRAPHSLSSVGFRTASNSSFKDRGAV